MNWHRLWQVRLALLPVCVFGLELVGQDKKERTTCIAVQDLDGDGSPDVVFGNREGSDQIFFNDGKGKFSDQSPSTFDGMREDTCAVALGDLDGDGDTDIAFLDSDGKIRLCLNGGARRFEETRNIDLLTGKGVAKAMVLGDLNGDGRPDLVIARLVTSNVLLLNDGKGRFYAAAANQWPADKNFSTGVVVADVDSDGDLDVMFGNSKNRKGRAGQNTLLLNDGKATFTRGTLPSDKTSTSFLVLADLDGDRRPEILQGVESKRGGRTRQYKNMGGGNFGRVKSSQTPAKLLNIATAAVGDVDGDADVDVIIAVRDACLLLWRNDGKGKLREFENEVLSRIVSRTTALWIVDVDGDDDLDVIVANDGEDNLLLRNSGRAEFAMEPRGQSFMNKVNAAELARIRALEAKYKFTLPDQNIVGGGRYRLRTTGRKQVVEPAVAAAISRGVAWLVKHQDQDGRWNCDEFMAHDPKDKRCDGPGKVGYDGPITALALWVLLADGNTGFTGEHRDQVSRGLAFLLRTQDANGCFKNRTHDYIYGHCMATLAICEAYGLSGDPRLRKPAEAALAYLSRHQSPRGGWGYARGKDQCDMSITAWAVQCYRAALDFGLPVDKRGRENAMAWIHSVTTESSGRAGYNKRGTMSSRHQEEDVKKWPPQNGEAMTAAALLCRYLMGETPETSKVLNRAANTIARRPPRWKAGHTDFYYWFLGSQSLHQHGGEKAAKWRGSLEAELLRNQRKDVSFAGSFDPESVWGVDGGRVFTTALALLSLQSVYRHAK